MWSDEAAMNTTNKLIVFCLLILALSVSACGGMTRSDKPATNTWWLEPYTGMTQERPSEPAPLVAISITVVPGLDTDRILTLSDDAELNQFAAARWADNLPELVTSLVGRTLEASGRFETAIDRAGRSSENCELRLELQEFFARLSPSGQTTGVQVAIEGRFQCESDEPVPLKLSASIPVNDERMSVIVAAFQQAMDSAMKDMIEQL
jgi:cholesterol transport system auxiliary component